MRRGRAALPVIVSGLALLYLPTYWEMAQGLWRSDEHAHAPLILLATLWLFWRRRALLIQAEQSARLLGTLLLVAGAICYAVGRALSMPLLEMGSQLPVISAVILLLGGTALLRQLRFPVALLLFTIPVPGMIIDALTAPLKAWVAISAENLLYWAGYPIARSGVTLSLSQYKLFVADACSGLHSMIFLTALGLLFIHLMARPSRLHNATLLLAILPIAWAANLLRVVLLLLLTYHFGDGATRGFMHELTGMAVFLAALLLLFAIDITLSKLIRQPRHTVPPADARHSAHRPATADFGMQMPILLAVTLIATAALSQAMVPKTQAGAEASALPLETLIPARFAGWQPDPTVLPVQPDSAAWAKADLFYNQVLARTYVNAQGQRIMLAIVYGANQLHDGLQIHRPEYCYKAQGFTLQAMGDIQFKTAFGTLPMRQLVATRLARIEQISYWITLGDTPMLPGLERKLAQLRHGLSGRIPDGFLVRVSTLENQSSAGYRLHEEFVEDLLAAMPPAQRARLIGDNAGQERSATTTPVDVAGV